MIEDRPPGVSRAGGLLTVIGGALIIVSAFLEWGKVTVGPLTSTLKGDTVVLISGIVIAVLGLLLAALPGRGGRIALAVIVIVVSVVAIFVTITFLVSDDSLISSAASSFHDRFQTVPQSRIETGIKAAVKAGRGSVDRNVGLYVALAGGVVGLIGGVVGLRRGPSAPMAPPPPPPGAYAGAPTGPPEGAPPAPTGGTTGAPPPPPPPPSPGGEPPPGGEPQGGGGFTG